ncbi:hypothetical protein ACGFSB_33705 [Streptomyces sp. NPDC048441]|uniref:hypothetical protein n=1 Tax=Streptomyces sp. NPDC048441 TaxID=3365552 RepID=UPI0037162D53
MASRMTYPPEPTEHGPWAHDRTWTGDARSAAACAVLLFGLLLALDAATGRLVPWRALLWLGLGVLLFAALTPPRVAVHGTILVSRGPLRTRSVRLDRLVTVRRDDGIAPRLVLRDASGGRVVLDPEVLVVNPPLWQAVDGGARSSVAAGSLLCGATALRRLSERIDRETGEGVFRASGLE